MESILIELQQQIESLKKQNAELMSFKQDYVAVKQSLGHMSVRLRKLCKRLEPTNDTVIEMQKISQDIRELVKEITLQRSKNAALEENYR